jgi:Asp-tRNA(Asn)/Glu-tRNA(Gln) amidotransferase C subunit
MLALGSDERGGLERSVAQMLEFFSAMDAIDLDAVPARNHWAPGATPQRADNPTAFNNRNPTDNPLSNSLVNNAPETSGRYVVIPNVL